MMAQKIKLLLFVLIMVSISNSFAQVANTNVRFSASGYTLAINYDKANKMSSGQSPQKMTLNDEEIQQIRNLFNEEFFALNEQRELQNGQRIVVFVQSGNKTKQIVYYHSETSKEAKKLIEIYTFFDALAKKF